VATFASVDAEQPDFVLIGGDFGHNNVDSLADKREQYKELYSLNSPLAPLDDFVTKILPHYALAHMWDDHDIGAQNADKTYPYKERALRVLNEFFPTYKMGPYGDWQSFRYGQAEFFLLDARSQRDPNPETDNVSKSMLDGDNLGNAGQLVWLEQGLLNSKAKWKFIISPVVFNPTLRKPDSWRGFQHERKVLVNFIQSNQLRGVIFISGDSHLGAIDDGSYSDFPEMLVPGPNLELCATVARPGRWSQGKFWTGINRGAPCNGYGLVTVSTTPNRVRLEVKDTQGAQKLFLEVKP
jgi:alkaline phosphatase D